MDIASWSDVHVCCSGSFRIERALSSVFPELAIHGNDVSVYSGAIAGLATGRPIRVEFREQLDFVNDLIADKDVIHQVAAVLVACEMSRFAKGKTRYNRSHFRHYKNNFATFLEGTVGKVERAAETLRLASYFAGDWREHADRAVDQGIPVLAFPPFFMGDYEAQFRFVEENIAWDAPDYDLYNPSQLREITRGLEDRGGTYCILTDQVWDDAEPVLKYVAGRKVPHYCYARTERSSYRRKTSNAQQFSYKPVDPSKLTKKSRVEIRIGTSAQLNFIKDIYLAKNIQHSSGLGNYLVMIDGMLAGLLIYDESPKTRAAYGNRTIYLLSDTSTTREGKISKLIAMMGLSKSLVDPLGRSALKRYERVVTTVRSKHPSSMKYRGVYKKLSTRWDEAGGNNVIQYAADTVAMTPQQVYQDWWRRYGPGRRH